MDIINSFENLQELVAGVRKQRFITNLYLDPIKHSVWITNKDCYSEIIGNTLFIIRTDINFWNVFYSTTTVEQLIADLKIFTNKYKYQTMMFDIIGRDIQCLPVIKGMQEVGCKFATSLVRMSRKSSQLDYDADSCVHIASENDIREVSKLLHEYFDPQTEQIPYNEELLNYARLGHVLLYIIEKKIVGFLIYELNATTIYLRYWFAHPEYRDMKVGSKLLRRFFEEGKNTKRQLFWVICSNDNAIKRYKHYGFVEENMYDYVMQYN